MEETNVSVLDEIVGGVVEDLGQRMSETHCGATVEGC